MSWQVPSSGYVLVLFALPEEQKPFSRVVTKEHARDKWIAHYTGAGAVNTRSFLSEHLKQFSGRERSWIPECRALLICGFAGGLAAELTPGMLVIGESVTNSANEIMKADSRLLAVAESVRLPEVYAMRGTIHTGDRVLGKAVEKQELAGRSEAIAVDMETFAAAQVAEEYEIPWLAARVVTDGVSDDMPLDFNALADADGNVDKKRVIAATLAHPWKIPGLIRLGTRSQQAAKNLALFLEAFLRALPDTNP